MTIDEAIKQEQEKAKISYDCANKSIIKHIKTIFTEQENNHKQVAEWLKELKAYKEQTDGDLISRQMAIDIVVFECGEWTGLAKEISKQLKQLPSTEKTTINSTKTTIIDGDLISRKAVIDVILSVDNGENHIDERTTNVIGYIEQLPSAEKTAEWITKNKITYSGSFWEIKCSNCGKESDDIYKYCPNCGAKMEESGDK